MVRALLTLKENKMSTFPTKILLASDSSDTAAHAMDLAVELCEQTGSQLHLVYVGEDAYSATLITPEAADLEGWREKTPYSLSNCSSNPIRWLAGC
jgi:hypothetical protein